MKNLAELADAVQRTSAVIQSGSRDQYAHHKEVQAALWDLVQFALETGIAIGRKNAN